ncbi:NB-ARC domain-containing protein [Streptomyces sp. NPDC005727]|uniref:NB-ARC domain-containing protein n=1 Tax=Streptomyces sp. NPDC005727 TaxID=3157053 RepID=UPI0033C62EE8
MWAAAVVALASLGVALAIVLALAGNAATANARWPWLLDELRQHPWWSVVVFGALSIVAGGVAAWVQLRPPVGWDDPPPPPAMAVAEWFVDRAQTRAAAVALCRGGQAVGITTSLWGAGGFGKTTLANAVCAHRRVRRRFRSRIYPVTIGRDVRGRAAVTAKVAEVTRFITGDTTEFDDPDLAGAHLGRLLDQRTRTLLVLDDVWEAEQLEPFLKGGRRCVRLVTTRNPSLLPNSAHRIPVDQMSHAQARAALTWNLPSLPETLVNHLLEATGRWALLLRLTNRLIAEQGAGGADPAATAERILHRLRDDGPAAVDDPTAAWNLDDPRQRNQAVKASIEAATTLLPPGGPDRFAELGVFAEDESVPVPMVALLWQASGGLTDDQTRTLCRDLERLSLLTLNRANGGTISLHDVIRDYLRSALGTAGLPTAQPLAPTHPRPERTWWQLTDGYLLDHLIDHLLAAGNITLAEAVAGDLRWVEARLVQRGPTAPWSDLSRIDTAHTRPLARSLAQTAHLLTPTDPPHALTGVLHTRLDTHPHWHPQISACHQDFTQRPCLETQWPLADAPAPALQRILTGHTGWVEAVAIGPDGTWLATASNGVVRIWDRATGTCTATLTDRVETVAIASDGTWLATGDYAGEVRIWDRATGTCTVTLTGHSDHVASVAIALDGTWLATGDYAGEVRIWDRATGACTAVLADHTVMVDSVAIAPDGTWLATGRSDGDVRIWDRATGTCTAVLADNTDRVASVAIASDGTWLATGDYAGEVRIWDRATGTCTATLTNHTSWVLSVAIAPDGTWLAIGGSGGEVRIWDRDFTAQTPPSPVHTDELLSVAVAPDGTWLATSDFYGEVRIWDRATGTCTATLTNHTDQVASVAIAPDSTWLATASADRTVRLWDRTTATCTATLTGHTSTVLSVVIAPDSTWLATASADRTVRLWDRTTATCTATLTGHTSTVLSVVIAPDSTWLATGDYDGKVRIWDRTTGTCTATLTNHTSRVESVAIAPDGTWFATASSDRTVRLWDRATGTCRATLTDHTDEVLSVAIAPDGTWLATASRDRTVRIWNAAERGIAVIARAEGALYSCAWGTGHDLAAVGARGLYLWKLLT